MPETRHTAFDKRIDGTSEQDVSALERAYKESIEEEWASVLDGLVERSRLTETLHTAYD